MLDGITRGMRYSDEERKWLNSIHTKRGDAWRPPSGSKLAESSVNGMTRNAQWSYKANSSTRAAKCPTIRKAKPTKATRVSAAQLRRRIEFLERHIEMLGFHVPMEA